MVALNASKLYPKMTAMVNVLCIFYHNKKVMTYIVGESM
jgi:hypothetical protein